MSTNHEFDIFIKTNISYTEKITKPIMDGLKEVKFNEKNIHVVNSTKEAFSLVRSLTDGKEAYCLIENDLPDIYNE